MVVMTAEALDYLLARVQSGHQVEVGAKQVQRRAVSVVVRPVGQPASGSSAAKQEQQH